MLKEDKLECSEELGDIVKPFDTTLALACYLRAGAHAKVISCLAELQQFEKIIPYCQKVGYQPNFLVLISSLIRSSPDRASEFAVSLLQNPETASQIDIEKIADLFFSQNHIQQGTSLLLDALKEIPQTKVTCKLVFLKSIYYTHHKLLTPYWETTSFLIMTNQLLLPYPKRRDYTREL